MSNKRPKVSTPIEIEKRAIAAARRKFLREQKKLAREQQPILPGLELVPFFPNLKGGKNDR